MFSHKRKFPGARTWTAGDTFVLLAREAEDYRSYDGETFLGLLKENPEAANWKDANGTTGLMAAAETGNPNFISALLAAGANIHARDNDGETALSYAVQTMDAKPEIAAALLDAGADINTANDRGETPLMIAASAHNRAALKFLLGRGADTERRNVDGKTALQIVEERFAAAARSTTSMFGALNTEGPIIDILRGATAPKEMMAGATRDVRVHKPLHLVPKH
jgi:ankyrin repeat protein